MKRLSATLVALPLYFITCSTLTPCYAENTACSVLLRNSYTRTVLPTDTVYGSTTQEWHSIATSLFNPGWADYYGLKGKIVLDAGCGFGDFVKALRSRGIEAYGIDTMLSRGLEASPYFLKSDMRETPFEANQFDVIISTYSLFLGIYDGHRLDVVKSALIEFERILKPGGVIRLSGHDPQTISEALKSIPSLFVSREETAHTHKIIELKKRI